ncbi:MAG TPA: hypothetical protein VK818_15035, partial [Methylomirabilota bacterium]|nr:hypothetical protein [Methylomirabilota bacterium]
ISTWPVGSIPPAGTTGFKTSTFSQTHIFASDCNYQSENSICSEAHREHFGQIREAQVESLEWCVNFYYIVRNISAEHSFAR